MKIITVRHGETVANMMCIVDGQALNSPLTDNGKLQAQQVRDTLANEKIDLIITSPLVRAMETAEIINQKFNIEIISEPALMERNLGILEDAAKTDNFHSFRLWHMNLFIPDGESLPEFVERVHTCLENIKKEHSDKECVLLVTHGFVVRAIKWYFEGFPKNDSEIKTIVNCETAVYQL